MRTWLLSLAMMVVACGGHGKNTQGSKAVNLTPKDIAQRSSPAIVQIEVGDGDVRATGTGFILDKNGLIASNLHVVRGSKAIKVKLYGGEIYQVQQIAGFDPGRDLALLRIQPAKALPTVRLGDSDAMVAGDQIVAIGNPLGVFDYSVSSGLVSQVRPVCTMQQVEHYKANKPHFDELLAKQKRTDAETEELQNACPQELKILQISAPISQGSSGGPLFNQHGEVVGVTTAIITAGQNINLAIPTNYLKPIVAKPEQISLDKFAAATSEGDTEAKPKIDREIPDHPLTVLDGCSRGQIEDMVKAIWDAIDVGAPLYNSGNHKACYQIYENAATIYAKNPPCKGVKDAFTMGLDRANSMGEDYTKRAWAMRDTFDGLLKVSEKWAGANGGQPLRSPRPKK